MVRFIGSDKWHGISDFCLKLYGVFMLKIVHQRVFTLSGNENEEMDNIWVLTVQLDLEPNTDSTTTNY